MQRYQVASELADTKWGDQDPFQLPSTERRINKNYSKINETYQ